MGAIVISDVTKRIGRKRVLDQINLEILEGEFFSILSLEDEAKDTLAKILFNFKKPSSGSAAIYNFDVAKQSKEVKTYAAFVSKEALFPEQYRRKSLFQKTIKVHELESNENHDELLDYFDCTENIKVSAMDNRERRLTSIVNALLSQPKVLIVQDATDELTPSEKTSFLSYLKNLQTRDNLTILFLSDDLALAQRYSDRIAYLYEGRIRDIEYIKDKRTKDKLLKIYSPVINKTDYYQCGAKLVGQEGGVDVFYFDGELPKLTEVLYRQGIEDYNLEGALLQDKINAYYGPNANRTIDNNFSQVEEEKVHEVPSETLKVEPVHEVEEKEEVIIQEEEEAHLDQTANVEATEDKTDGDTKVINKEDLLSQLEKGNDMGGFNQ